MLGSRNRSNNKPVVQSWSERRRLEVHLFFNFNQLLVVLTWTPNVVREAVEAGAVIRRLAAGSLICIYLRYKCPSLFGEDLEI